MKGVVHGGPSAQSIRLLAGTSASAMAVPLRVPYRNPQCKALGGEPGARAISAGDTLFAASLDRPGPKTKISMTFSDGALR